MSDGRDDEARPDWTFLTNHGHVLLLLAADPGMRLRDVGVQVGITERAAQRIVTDLVDAGYLSRTREGRRNRYTVHSDLPLRHPNEQHHKVAELLEVLTVLPGAPGRA